MRPTPAAALRTAIAAATLAVGSLALATPALAGHGTLPEGSYLRSCWGAQVEGGTLYATCRTGRGRPVRTQLAAVRHCVGDIENRDGQLACWLDIPQGSYLESCRRIRDTGDALTAMCRTHHGDLVYTELRRPDRCVGDIANLDGQLWCDRPGRGHAYGRGWDDAPPVRGPVRPVVTVPPGSYLRSCTQVGTDGSLLSARCQTRSGAWVHTSLPYAQSCRGDIANLDGRLTCAGGPRVAYR